VFKIVGNHVDQLDGDVLHKLIKQFVPHSQEKLGWDQPVTINLLADPENARNPLGKTAHYQPNTKKITLFTVGRHPKDVLRSLSHELVHHKQNCQGLLTGDMNTSDGYAQEDEHLRNMELEAYEKGNICFRDWEDGVKRQKQQQENKEVSAKKINEVEPGEAAANVKFTKGPCKGMTAKEAMLKGCTPGPGDHKEEKEETKENWFKGNKNQLLFEELTRKWTKKLEEDNVPASKKKKPEASSALAPYLKALGADPLEKKAAPAAAKPAAAAAPVATKPAAAAAAGAAATKAKRLGTGTRVPLSKRHGGRKMGRTLWKAMTTKAKGLGKKWSQLPYGDETRVAYRDWLAGKPVSAAYDPDKMMTGGPPVGIAGKTPAGVPEESIKDVAGRTITEKGFAAKIYSISRQPKHSKNKLALDVIKYLKKIGAIEMFKKKLRQRQENWLKGDKDQLLFEELTKKWTKKR